VSTNLGTNVNRRKATNSMDMNIMVDVCAERDNERDRVSLKIRDTGEKVKEVSFYVLFLRDPMFFSMVIDDGILVWVTVNSESTGGGMEEIGEKVGYRLFM